MTSSQKLKTLKIRLSQIDEQIEKSVNTESAQYELFLVIDRLEGFSKKVGVTLDIVDFNTKREIIRALVKRVEIYKEEVVVVFRIDPEAPANDKTCSTSRQRPEDQLCTVVTRVVSPMLSNIVLNELDHKLEERNLGIVAGRMTL